MIYLDNSATTRPCEAAVAAAKEAMENCWGNPSSIHRLGNRALERIELARSQVAAALGADKKCVYFTSGGTEADNWAIFASAEKLGKRGRHIITTSFEHHAVLHPMAKLEAQGFEVTYLDPGADGTVSLEAFRAAIRPDTIFASIMMVNNEVGAVFKVPFNAKTLVADLISVSAHKIHGIKGAGALYIRPNLHLPAYQHGGGQELNLRSGTEAVPAICAFGAAAEALRKTAREDMAAMASLRDRLVAALKELDGVQILGVGAAPHIVSLSIPGLRSQLIINRLQDMEIYVSAGSACSRGHRSHVLLAAGADNRAIDGAVRVSFSRDNTPEDVDKLIEGLKTLL